MSIAAVSNDEDEVARRLQRHFCYTDIAEKRVSCGAGQTRGHTHEARSTGFQNRLQKYRSNGAKARDHIESRIVSKSV